MKHISHLKRLRTDAGISQAQLAAYLGVGESQISMIENGKRELTLKNVLRLSSLLNVDSSLLVPGEEGFVYVSNSIGNYELEIDFEKYKEYCSNKQITTKLINKRTTSVLEMDNTKFSPSSNFEIVRILDVKETEFEQSLREKLETKIAEGLKLCSINNLELISKMIPSFQEKKDK